MWLDGCRIQAYLTKIMRLLWLCPILSHWSSWRWLGLCLNDRLSPLKLWFVQNLASPSHCNFEFPCQSSDYLARSEPTVERKVQTPPIRCSVGRDERGFPRKVRLCRSLLDCSEGFSQSVRTRISFLMYSTWISKRLLTMSPTFLREDDNLPAERR